MRNLIKEAINVLHQIKAIDSVDGANGGDSADEVVETVSPVVEVIQPARRGVVWYAETGVKTKFEQQITDKNGDSYVIMIEVSKKLSHDDYLKDLEQILLIHQAGIDSHQNYHLQLSSHVLRQIIGLDSLIIIAKIQDLPVAFALLNQVPGAATETWEILIEVAPEYRKMGIATLIFFAILDHPGQLPPLIEAEIESMNHPVFRLLQKAQEKGLIRYTLKNFGPSTQAHIELVQSC